MSVKRLSPQEGSERLKERRRKVRRRIRILFSILFVVLAGVFVWLTWQPYVRIVDVDLVSADPTVMQRVQGELLGSYLWLVPRNSYFFIPKSAIRKSILASDPRIQAVSIERESFTRIRVTLHERTPIARWCGLQPTDPLSMTPYESAYCYMFDANGLVYAAADVATGTAPLNSFDLYDSLKNDAPEPLRATLAHAAALPTLFDFARKISTLGSLVASIVIRGDEADLYLASGTRITYVLGYEEDAFTNLTSAKENLVLSDGSLEYVDLRFAGKVYLKRKSDTVTE